MDGVARSYRRMTSRPLSSEHSTNNNSHSTHSPRNAMPKQALIVIDLQNDYFDGGKFPLWNADTTLSNVGSAIARAKQKNVPIVLVQHVADPTQGIAPFFNEGTAGADIHPRILSAAPDATIVVKHYADGFHHTRLEATLTKLGVEELLICGMMTQNCVTHTAISKAAEKYSVKILTDACTTVDQMVHLIALNAVSTRVTVAESTAVL
jgi:nicotinamidase-related amidase